MNIKDEKIVLQDDVDNLLAKINFNKEIIDSSGNNNIEKVEGGVFLVENNIGQNGYFEKGAISLVREGFLFSNERNFSLLFWIKTGESNDAVIISNKDWRSGSNIGWLVGINDGYLVCNWKDDSRSRLDVGAEQNIKIADKRAIRWRYTF